MDAFLIRPATAEDLGNLIEVWNECVDAGEVLYAPLTEEYALRKFGHADGRVSGMLAAVEPGGRPVGFLHGSGPGALPPADPDSAYLTFLLVDRRHRGKGAGTALFSAFAESMRSAGADSVRIANGSPVQLDWRIPGTPGHDHNNMPGLDTGCAGAGFFARAGFMETGREVSMYRALEGYASPPEAGRFRKRLAGEGIHTGPYDPSWDCSYDGMCTRVGSEYWRSVLRTEIEALRAGRPNADSRFWPDGVRPSGPRALLTAVHEDRIVAFTGPVDLQRSGRGWFTGICTDPLYERRGIATVLFDLLMRAFVAEGAAFTTLFTGENNHAQKIYLRAGLRPVRTFAEMELPLRKSAERAL